MIAINFCVPSLQSSDVGFLRIISCYGEVFFIVANFCGPALQSSDSGFLRVISCYGEDFSRRQVLRSTSCEDSGFLTIISCYGEGLRIIVSFCVPSLANSDSGFLRIISCYGEDILRHQVLRSTSCKGSRFLWIIPCYGEDFCRRQALHANSCEDSGFLGFLKIISCYGADILHRLVLRFWILKDHFLLQGGLFLLSPPSLTSMNFLRSKNPRRYVIFGYLVKVQIINISGAIVKATSCSSNNRLTDI